MFNKHKDKPKRRKRGGFSLIRTFISLTMICLLSLGVYSAYRSFSGIDPMKVDPQTALHSLLSSQSTLDAIGGLLSFSPKKLIPDSVPLSNGLSMSSSSAPSVQAASSSQPAVKSTPKPSLDFTFAVMSDSHNDLDDLKKALAQSKAGGAQFVIGLGDYTDVGTIVELTNTKKQFDASGMTYYSIPGDHDLWDSRTKGFDPLTYYHSVFGANYQSFTFRNVEFLMMDNSDNYTGISTKEGQFIDDTLNKLSSSKPKLSLAFVSTPLYHPSSDHYMGKVTPALTQQASDLAHKLKTRGFSEVFAGDTHFYSHYTDPKEDMSMTAIGAITRDRNIQAPRFVMVDVYTDGSYNITDTEVAPKP